MILEKSEDLKFGFFILREDLKFGGPSDPTETLYQSKDFSRARVGGGLGV
jgi:hypothetical protein